MFAQEQTELHWTLQFHRCLTAYSLWQVAINKTMANMYCAHWLYHYSSETSISNNCHQTLLTKQWQTCIALTDCIITVWYSVISIMWPVNYVTLHNVDTIRICLFSQGSTWMGDRQGRPGAVNLGPFVGVGLNMWPTVYIVVIVLTRT